MDLIEVELKKSYFYRKGFLQVGRKYEKCLILNKSTLTENYFWVSVDLPVKLVEYVF